MALLLCAKRNPSLVLVLVITYVEAFAPHSPGNAVRILPPSPSALFVIGRKRRDPKLPESGKSTVIERSRQDEEIPYSLGVQSYQNKKAEQKKLRPVVKFFSQDSHPYTLDFQSNNGVIVRRPINGSSINSIETITLRQDSGQSSVQSNVEEEGGILEPRVVKYSIDTPHNQTNTQQYLKQKNKNNTLAVNGDGWIIGDADGIGNATAISLPVPFAPQNRTSRISLAENLMQLSSSIPEVWDSSVAYSTEAINNMSAQAMNISVSSLNMSSYNTSSLAEDLMKFVEEVVQQPVGNASSQIINFTAPFPYPSFSTTFKPSFQSRNNRTALQQQRQARKQQQKWTSPQPLTDLVGKAPTDTLTVQDLDQILRANGYVRQSELNVASGGRGVGSLPNLLSTLPTPTEMAEESLKGVGKPVSEQQHAFKSTKSSSEDAIKGVAFPQPSVLSFKSLQWGTAISSGLFFMLLFSAIQPNLWLFGAVTGSVYGYDVGKQLPVTMPKSVLPGILVRIGTKLATTALKGYDFVVGLIFMWKTGVLSYEYWKRYAALDQRFKIQDKVDAWNARFIEGKENFDKWEQENEVGRKVLATLRTVWLVEERSLKKGMLKRRRQSKYRLVQLLYDLAYNLGKFFSAVFRMLTGGGSTELTEFLQGIRIDISQSKVEGIVARVGAVMAALIAVNVVGALFSISPLFLIFCAVIGSVIWPTWITELIDRLGQFFSETRAVGRGETTSQSAIRVRSSQDRKRYHFFISNDGKKRYYRTGQPLWPWLRKKEEPKKGILGFLQNAK